MFIDLFKAANAAKSPQNPEKPPMPVSRETLNGERLYNAYRTAMDSFNWNAKSCPAWPWLAPREKELWVTIAKDFLKPVPEQSGS
jgi:hypothetical protein